MLDPSTARDILRSCHAAEVDFHSLRFNQVERLLEFADLHKYRAPKVRNGSRGRYFHSYLCRLARRPER